MKRIYRMCRWWLTSRPKRINSISPQAWQIRHGRAYYNLGIHSPVQLRNARAPSDWQQTVAEQIDREQPWLKWRY